MSPALHSFLYKNLNFSVFFGTSVCEPYRVQNKSYIINKNIRPTNVFLDQTPFYLLITTHTQEFNLIFCIAILLQIFLVFRNERDAIHKIFKKYTKLLSPASPSLQFASMIRFSCVAEDSERHNGVTSSSLPYYFNKN